MRLLGLQSISRWGQVALIFSLKIALPVCCGPHHSLLCYTWPTLVIITSWGSPYHLSFCWNYHCTMKPFKIPALFTRESIFLAIYLYAHAARKLISELLVYRVLCSIPLLPSRELPLRHILRLNRYSEEKWKDARIEPYFPPENEALKLSSGLQFSCTSSWTTYSS